MTESGFVTFTKYLSLTPKEGIVRSSWDGIELFCDSERKIKLKVQYLTFAAADEMEYHCAENYDKTNLTGGALIADKLVLTGLVANFHNYPQVTVETLRYYNLTDNHSVVTSLVVYVSSEFNIPKEVKFSSFKPEIKDYKPLNFKITRIPIKKDDPRYDKWKFSSSAIDCNWMGKEVKVNDEKGVITRVDVISFADKTELSDYEKYLNMDSRWRLIEQYAKELKCYNHQVILSGLTFWVTIPSKDKNRPYNDVTYTRSIDLIMRQNTDFEPLVIERFVLEGLEKYCPMPAPFTLFDTL